MGKKREDTEKRQGKRRSASKRKWRTTACRRQEVLEALYIHEAPLLAIHEDGPVNEKE